MRFYLYGMAAPRILVCPLDWGLGHAVRCVPIIRALLNAGAVPIIAADNGPLELLNAEFPDGEFLKFPGSKITYPKSGGSMAWSMLKQSPALLSGIRKEQIWIGEAVKRHGLHGIISDNRFGAYSKQVPSVYITHQLNIQTGNILGNALARKQHVAYMKNYAQVWVPDHEDDNNLSGKLSHGNSIPKHVKYIGPIGRFNDFPKLKTQYDASLILSGPEPQRSLLEAEFIRQTEAFPNKKFALVRGKKEAVATHRSNLDIIPMATEREIKKLYGESAHIICRSGYTSIMEMALSGRSAWLIPTPGQTEQEYLARNLDDRFGFHYISQKYFVLESILMEKPSQVQHFEPSSEKLQETVKEFITIASNQKL